MVKHTRDCVTCGGVLNKTRSRPINVCSKCKHKAWKERAIERGVDFEKLEEEKRKRQQNCKSLYTVDGTRIIFRSSEYDALLKKQEGVCANCRQPERIVDARGGVKRLCVDHCHTSGRVRGLLCGRCNKSIGCLGDDIAGLERALAYLRSG